MILRDLVKSAIIFSAVIYIAGCVAASAPAKKPITELFSDGSSVKFDFQPSQEVSQQNEYTIGIVDMSVTYQFPALPEESWITTMEPLEKSYAKRFTKEFQVGLEKILLSKGFKVLGPFGSFSEMTFLEKERCDFVIVPEAVIIVKPFSNEKTIMVLPEYDGGLNDNYARFGSTKARIDLSAELNMFIAEPITEEKLLRNRVTSDIQGDDSLALFRVAEERNQKGTIIRTIWIDLNNLGYKGYHNREHAFGLALTKLYADFMPRIDRMITREQFDYLYKVKAKDTLREKKVYQ